MPNKLRRSSPRVSFLAFQDMITTFTGVLIIVMLLLSTEVSHRAAAAARTPRDPIGEQLAQARAQLASAAETLSRRQAELKTLTNTLFVIPEPDRLGRQVVLVVLSATTGCCSRLGQTNLTEFRARANRTEFGNVLQTLEPTRDRLVFYVRPSGITHFEKCLQLARTRGFTIGNNIGYDAAREDKRYVLLSP